MTALNEQKKQEIALAVLKGDRALNSIATEYGVFLWQAVEWAILFRQTGGQIFSDTFNGRIERPCKTGENDRLVFIHIPKTSGTAMNSHLVDLYHVHAICPARSHMELENLALQSDLSKYSLFSGHFYYSWFAQYSKLDERTRYVTMLRHPLRRVISTYLHWMRATLRTYEHWSPLNNIENVQCLFLSPLNVRGAQPSMREHLEAAKESLRSFFFVGIQEKFDDSIDLLFREMQLNSPLKNRVLNVAQKNNLKLSCDLHNEIMEKSWADLELYEYAQNLFNCRLEDQHFVEQPELIFSGESLSQINYRIDEKLCGENWHEREGLTSSDPWRWSGPHTQSTLHFSVKINENAKYRVSICIINAMSSNIFNSFRMFINDTPIELAAELDERKRLFLVGVVSGGQIMREIPILSVSMTVAETLRHCDVDPLSPDERRCGFAFTEFNFSEI